MQRASFTKSIPSVKVMRQKSKEVILALQSELEEERYKQKEFQREIEVLREHLQDGISVQADYVHQSQQLQQELAKLKESDQTIRWESDSDVSNCRKCESSFSVTRRRHHCRQCGRIFCSDCSNVVGDLPGCQKNLFVFVMIAIMDFVRVCFALLPGLLLIIPR